MVEVLRTHDFLPLASPSFDFDPDDWLACDYDVDCPVYLFVHPAYGRTPSRWSLAWPVGAGNVRTRKMTAWRHVQLESLADPLASEVEMHYGYFGAITKTAGPEVVAARRYELGMTNLAQRREIERLAKMTPVLEEVEGWSCQDWVEDLLQRMVATGLVSGVMCHDAIAQAHSAGKSALSVHCVGADSCFEA